MISQTQRPSLLLEADPLLAEPEDRKIKVAQFGLGVIGVETLKTLAKKPWADIVGGIDVDPDKIGKSLGELTGVASLEHHRVYSKFNELISETQPDVILHAAGSSVSDSFDQMEPMVQMGVNIISSCEQLVFPALREPVRSKEFDDMCRTYGAAVVGTGVNPGFVMDVLPLCLTGVSKSVDNIYVERVVNASTRRMQLQKKIGSGMPPAEFRALFKAGQAGHAGFRESAALICHCLNWKSAQIVETCEPMIADHDIETEFFSVKTGQTCGLHQIVTAMIAGQPRLTMDLKMYLDAADPHDAIKIQGTPPLEMLLRGGVAGDIATPAAMVNLVPRLLKAGPGLHLMTDLSVPCMA